MKVYRRINKRLWEVFVGRQDIHIFDQNGRERGTDSDSTGVPYWSFLTDLSWRVLPVPSPSRILYPLSTLFWVGPSILCKDPRTSRTSVRRLPTTYQSGDPVRPKYSSILPIFGRVRRVDSSPLLFVLHSDIDKNGRVRWNRYLSFTNVFSITVRENSD